MNDSTIHQEDDFNGSIGPECTVEIQASSEEMADEIKRLLIVQSTTTDADDSLPEWFGKELISRACSVLSGYIISSRVTSRHIRVEEEWRPWVSHDGNSVTIGVSISVLHHGEDTDALNNLLYAVAFEGFLKREFADIVSTLLRPKLGWISPNDCKVEVNAIGWG